MDRGEEVRTRAQGSERRRGALYLVVGGVAVVLHGYLRTTGGLDLVVQLSPDNLLLALDTLGEFGFRPRPPVPLRSFADPETRRSWLETKNLQVFSLWHAALPGFEVDLFVEEPFDFDEVWGRRVDVPLASTIAPVVCLEDLLSLKRRTGRTRDLEDVAVLETLAQGDGND